MKKKLEILQHSLGLDRYGDGRQYRNYFITGPGSTDFDDCMALVEMGLMENRGAQALAGGDHYFTVTPKGIDYVALNSPPAPKLTRSQKRYRDYLKSDCELSFGEYIRAVR